MSEEFEYKEIFLAEAQESYEQLNSLFTALEKDNRNKQAIDSIFRITHTLKGNAMGMGFQSIAEMSHIMEDVFNAVKSGHISLDGEMFSSLYRANDILGKLILAVRSGETIKYKGIKTKLEVALKKALEEKGIVREQVEAPSEQTQAESITKKDHEEAEEDSQADHQITLSDVVQVPVRKLDALLNIIGELIIEKDTLTAMNTERGYKSTDMARLHRITSDLQYGIMDVRLVQVGFLFNKFNRVLRDVAVLEKKKADLILEGTEIEIDRNILKILSDSLVHLVRNAVSHGIESPAVRIERGKSETGKVKLKARNEKDTVFIEVSDDGNGIDIQAIKKKAVERGFIAEDYKDVISDEEVIMCLFEPGFSNAEKITEVSGRGVGTDVVKRSVESIGGRISIETELGKGSTFILALPSSMAVKGALLFELNDQAFAIPLTHTEAVISIRAGDIHQVNNSLISNYHGKTISVIFLRDLFQGKGKRKEGELLLNQTIESLGKEQKLDVAIVSVGGKLIGLIVDKLLQQKEIVEKTLSRPVDNIDLFSGATILGDGNICLVLNVVGLVAGLFK